MEPKISLPCSQECAKCYTACGFLRWRVVSPWPNSQAEGPPLSAVRDNLLNILAATIHILRPSLPPATRGRVTPW